MPSTETDLAACPPQLRFHPRAALAALVAAHLVLAALQSVPVPQWSGNWVTFRDWGWLPFDAMRAASEGILLGQVAVLSVYISLGKAHVLTRLVRGAMLLLWFLLAQMSGTLMLDGGRDRLGFEEFFAQYAWMIAGLAIPLWLYRLAVGRALMQFGHRSGLIGKPHQFRLVHLMLVLTELAVLMGAIRLLVPWNRRWHEEIYQGLQEIPRIVSYEQIALGFLTGVSAVLISLHVARPIKAGVLLISLQTLLSLGLVAFLMATADSPEIPGAIDLWFEYWLVVASHCYAAALVIFLTFLAVRAIGYDFLPLPRRGGSGEGGRQSSAATSAA